MPMPLVDEWRSRSAELKEDLKAIIPLRPPDALAVPEIESGPTLVSLQRQVAELGAMVNASNADNFRLIQSATAAVVGKVEIRLYELLADLAQVIDGYQGLAERREVVNERQERMKRLQLAAIRGNTDEFSTIIDEFLESAVARKSGGDSQNDNGESGGGADTEGLGDGRD